MAQGSDSICCGWCHARGIGSSTWMAAGRYGCHVFTRMPWDKCRNNLLEVRNFRRTTTRFATFCWREKVIHLAPLEFRAWRCNCCQWVFWAIPEKIGTSLHGFTTTFRIKMSFNQSLSLIYMVGHGNKRRRFDSQFAPPVLLGLVLSSDFLFIYFFSCKNSCTQSTYTVWRMIFLSSRSSL